MKKRLVTYLLISAMAATVFAGCSKSGGDAADAAATGEAAVAEVVEEAAAEAATGAAEMEKAPIDEAVAAAEAAETAEAAEIAGTSDAAEAEIANTEEATAEEYVADEEEAAEDTTAAATTEEGEYLIVDPGTQYTVRFGGNVYASPNQVDSNIIDYVYPGYVLTIDERLDDFWYAITYWIDGYARTGYIKIQ